MRFPQTLLTALAATLSLGACNQTVEIDPAAMPWEVVTQDGRCESALEVRTAVEGHNASTSYRLVRTLSCPVRSGENDTLIQVRNSKGKLLWFEEDALAD